MSVTLITHCHDPGSHPLAWQTVQQTALEQLQIWGSWLPCLTVERWLLLLRTRSFPPLRKVVDLAVA